MCEQILTLKHDHADAQHLLGEMLREGKGCKRDVARALQLWEASLAGAVAAFNLGCVYSEGQHVPEDKLKA
eukprot:550915-Amphidinium_carterae.1